MLEEAKATLAGGVASSWQAAPPRAIWVAEGKGSRITDVDGTSYVDLHNGFGAMLVGHAHPAVVKAVQERVALGTHFAQPVEDLIPVSQELSRRFDQPKWRFANSGTEATLAAVNLMRVARDRPKIIKIEGTTTATTTPCRCRCTPSWRTAVRSRHPTPCRSTPACRPRWRPTRSSCPSATSPPSAGCSRPTAVRWPG
jgi:glutamate-1-semialdehyde aminotransferase